MVSTSPTPSDLLSPKNELVRAIWSRAFLWSCGSACLFGLLLFDLYLMSDLLVRRGVVDLAFDEVAAYERLTAQPGMEVTAADNAVSAQPHGERRLQQGLMATAWSMHQRWWGGIVRFLVRTVPALRRNYSALAVLTLAAVVISLMNGLVVSHIRALCLRAAIELATDLRERVHHQAIRIGSSTLPNHKDNDVVSLFTNEIERVREGVFRWNYRLSRHLLVLVLLVAFVLSIHWLLALQCLIPLAACWFLIEKEKLRFAAAKRLAEDRAKLDIRLLSEGLRKPRLISGYGMQEFEKQRFERYLQRVRSQTSSVKRGESWSRWIIRLLVLVSLTIVLFLVSSKTLLPVESRHHLASASALLMLGAFVLMYRSIDLIWELRFSHPSLQEAHERISRYLDQTPKVGHALGGKVLRPLSHTLQFESVCYATSDHGPVLDSFDLQLPAGDITALVSLNPLETLTLAYLLPRFLEPQSGRILFDGEDIAWVTLESLRASALLVDGADALFTGTVLENLSCGNPAYTIEDVTEAAKATRAHDVILKLSHGYDTVLGEHGEQLEVGERYLLALARALVRDPSLLIVREPAETLNEPTKVLLDDAYDELVTNRTVLFLPSRLSTVRRAQRVVLIHAGKVSEVESYAKLIKTSSLFRHWEYVCFNEFREFQTPL